MTMTMTMIDRVMANKQKLQEKATEIFGVGTIFTFDYLADESNDKKLSFEIKINNWQSYHNWYDLFFVEVGEIEVAIHIYAENQSLGTLEVFDSFVEYAKSVITISVISFNKEQK